MISLTKLSHREREREREREERYLGTDFTMISGQPNSIMI
jgi:hypothetical protein